MLDPQYIHLFLLIAVGIGIGVALPLLTELLGPRRRKEIKMIAYESGMDPVGDAHDRFSIKFYLIAMVFIIFDVEIIFMYPWAVQFKQLGLFGFVEMFLFILILFVGYIYLWKKGGFEWEK